MSGDPSRASNRAAELGSAHTGVRHWWLQRLTAVVLVPVGLWLVISLLGLVSAPHEAARAWLASPGNAIAILLLLGVGFLHLALGLQVVVEDYVHDRRVSIALLMLVPITCSLLALIGGFSVLHVAFTA
jgi:succinate dehydrogenase / fumarate reductase membrane anchor subunit